MNEENYKKLIRNPLPTTATKHIVEGVMSDIRKTRLTHAKIYITLYGMCAVGALVAIKPAVDFVISGAAQSGFAQYFDLVFYGGAAIVQAWSDLLMSIMESIPIMETAVLSAVVVGFVYCLRHAVKILAELSLYKRESVGVLERQH